MSCSINNHRKPEKNLSRIQIGINTSVTYGTPYPSPACLGTRLGYPYPCLKIKNLVITLTSR